MSVYGASWMEPMSVAIEEEGSIDVVRYSGLHRCRPEDHERGCHVGEDLARRVDTGRRRVLIDVCRLRIVYVSGCHDLVRSWMDLLCRPVRVAIVWDPMIDSGDLPEAIEWVGRRWLDPAPGNWITQRLVPSHGDATLRIVREAEAAFHYLLSDEPDPPRA